MKKIFFKFFLSIFSIAILALAIQNGILLAGYTKSESQWKHFIYEDFIDNLESNLRSSSFPNFSLDTASLFSTALQDSRVSGFLVKDQEGNIAFTVGQAPDGKFLTSLVPDNSSMEKVGKRLSSKVRRTSLNIVFDGYQFDIHRINETDSDESFFIPNGIKANDVIGTVTIKFQSQTLSSIDILSYSPRTYEYSQQIINSCIKSLLIAIPICLFVSLIYAGIVSTKNAKYINNVRKALNDLSQEKENVSIKPNKNSSLNEITVAIHELDKNLQSNKKSRQAWLTSISHDLSTPATSIKMVIDGLNDGIFKPNKTTLKELQKESDTLCERINRVIDFSTLQSEKATIEKMDCKAFTDSFSNYLENVSVVCKTETIECDKNLMKRAIIELLNNAFSATNDLSENEKNIELTIDKNNGLYSVVVSNKGKLPANFDSSALFDPWTKGDTSRGTSGNGLGLSIVGTIAKLHNGNAHISEQDNIVISTIEWSL